MFVATLFGVFLVPAMFALVERIVRHEWRRSARRRELSPHGVEPV
jgi:hypothetical protein